MAQRIVHYGLSIELIKRINIKNEVDFIIGSIIPDSHNKTTGRRDKSHYIVRKDGKKKIDFSKFFSDNKNKIIENDLYLGYYIHLVEDALYRNFFYIQKNLDKNRNEKEFKEKMYSDYHNLNYLLIKKYNLKKLKISLEEIPDELGLTMIEQFQNELDMDFYDKETSKLYYLNENLIDEFFEYVINLLLEEIKSIRVNNKTILNSDNYWY